MKILEVPVYNEDGSINFNASVSEKEAQLLLQFAMNYLIASGISLHNFMSSASTEIPEDATLN